MPEQIGRLTVFAYRGGTIGEVSAFLRDLEAAYLALYQLDHGAREF